VNPAHDVVAHDVSATHLVPARGGLAIPVDAGQRIAIVDVSGGQVGDFFAFVRDDTTEYLSASHTRAYNSRLFPEIGQPFVSTRRRPILTVLADTSPGYHDMLIAACDPVRYEQLGAVGWHASCAENMQSALAAVGVDVGPVVPQPFNLFMRTPAGPDGIISWLPAESRPGDRFEMEALVNLWAVLSCCPSDMVGINAGELSPLEMQVSSPVT
jgi:uncharacterized protein YcgI (DUF1989 family)